MDLDSIQERESEFKKTIKKNSLLCMGRSRLHTNRSEKLPEKMQVQTALHSLYKNYNEKFNTLRKINASESEILTAGQSKRIVLDVIDQCVQCDREIDVANRALPRMN